MIRRSRPARWGLIAVAFALCLTPIQGRAAQEPIQVLSRDEKVAGMTLGEWMAAWQQWWMSIPKNTNPTLDTTGVRIGIGQHLPVWFLPEAAPYTVQVPAGAALYYPGPVQASWDFPGRSTEAELQAGLQEGITWLDTVTFAASLNGESLGNVQQHRVRTPLFNVVLPPGNVVDFPVMAGKVVRRVGVAEGYGFLLPPLPVGKHILRVRVAGTIPGTGGTFGGTYVVHLIVQEPNKSLQ